MTFVASECGDTICVQCRHHDSKKSVGTTVRSNLVSPFGKCNNCEWGYGLPIRVCTDAANV